MLRTHNVTISFQCAFFLLLIATVIIILNVSVLILDAHAYLSTKSVSLKRWDTCKKRYTRKTLRKHHLFDEPFINRHKLSIRTHHQPTACIFGTHVISPCSVHTLCLLVYRIYRKLQSLKKFKYYCPYWMKNTIHWNFLRNKCKQPFVYIPYSTCIQFCYLCFAFNTRFTLILLWKAVSDVPIHKISFNHRFFSLSLSP